MQMNKSQNLDDKLVYNLKVRDMLNSTKVKGGEEMALKDDMLFPNICFNSIDDLFVMCLESCGARATERMIEIFDKQLPNIKEGTASHSALISEIDILSKSLFRYAVVLEKLHKK